MTERRKAERQRATRLRTSNDNRRKRPPASSSSSSRTGTLIVNATAGRRCLAGCSRYRQDQARRPRSLVFLLPPIPRPNSRITLLLLRTAPAFWACGYGAIGPDDSGYEGRPGCDVHTTSTGTRRVCDTTRARASSVVCCRLEFLLCDSAGIGLDDLTNRSHLGLEHWNGIVWKSEIRRDSWWASC